jgi:hypothetical protein
MIAVSSLTGDRLIVNAERLGCEAAVLSTTHRSVSRPVATTFKLDQVRAGSDRYSDTHKKDRRDLWRYSYPLAYIVTVLGFLCASSFKGNRKGVTYLKLRLRFSTDTLITSTILTSI